MPQILQRNAVELAHRHDQELPTRPIWYCFPASVQERIKRNPFGAIALAVQAIADREAVYSYVDALPVKDELKREIKSILLLDYQNARRK